MADVEVAIVGGGISGLAAAYELETRGVRYALLERADRLGGVIRTEEVEGFTIDGGPDSLLVQKPAAIALCEELGLGPRLVPTLPPRTAYVVRADRLVPLPPASVLGIPTRAGPLIRSRLLSLGGKLRLAREVAIPPRATDEDESVGSFFRRRFGEEAVRYLAEPLLAGIHAGDVERLSMQSLFPRLVQVEREHGSLIRRFRALQAETPPAADGLFRSLPGGIGELTRTLTQRLTGTIRTSQRVEQIRPGPPFTIEGPDGTLAARSVILATPAHVTAMLVGALDSELGALCGEIEHTSTATVALGYDATAVSRPLVGTGFVVPRAETSWSLMAGSWVSSKWPGRAPEGQVLLRGFLGGVRNPEILERSDAELVEATHGDFARLIGLEGPPRLRRVFRWPRLNPQHEVGHRERLARIESRIARHPGLAVTGAAFRGVGIPDCVANARAVAARIAEAE